MPSIEFEMSKAAPANSDVAAKLPRRDWILLPLISLLTIVVLAKGTDRVARHAFPEPKLWFNSCFILNDPSTGVRALPHADCWEEGRETPAVEHRFNGCGHHADMECGPKPPDIFRVVMIGSSYPMGLRVPQAKGLAPVLGEDLTRMSGRNVEVYNESMMYETSHVAALRFKEALEVKPDAVLWVLTYWDIEMGANPLPISAPQPTLPFTQEIRTKVSAAIRDRSGLELIAAVNESVRDRLSNTATAFMMSHFLAESQSAYIKGYLSGSGPAYLRARTSPEWIDHLKQFDRDCAEIEREAQAAGVPVLTTYIPFRAQAAMISIGNWPQAYDPYRLNTELSSIVKDHGGNYIDISPDFRTVPNPEQYYFPADGHLTAEGHALVAQMIAGDMIQESTPELRSSGMQAKATAAR